MGGSTLSYLYSDHLGSASLATNATGGVTSEMRYYPYGETRWSAGTMATDRRFTGQREETGLGLYDYVARRYDPRLGRFLQADTVVPDPANPQSLNRYAYVYNSPLIYADPLGHFPQEAILYDWSELPSPLLEYYRRWDYSPYTEPGRDEYWAWYNEHPTYDPATDPVMRNPEQFGVNWAPAITDNRSFHLEWVWIQAGAPFSGVDYEAVAEMAASFGTSVVQAAEYRSLALAGVRAYQVGTYRGLKAVSVAGDGFDIHHGPQAHPTGQVISGYDWETAPSIVLLHGEHLEVNSQNLAGYCLLSPRDLLAKTIWDLRTYTGAPNSALQELIWLNRTVYPGAYGR